jgi:hypothetical protein
MKPQWTEKFRCPIIIAERKWKKKVRCELLPHKEKERKGKSNPGFHILFCSSPSPNWKQHYENIYIVLVSPPIQYHNAKSLWLTERSPNQIFGLYPEIWNAGHLLQVGLYAHFVGNLSCFESSTSKANTTSRPKLDIDQPQRTGQLGVLCLSDEVLQKEYE